ncbi:hypothetical protein BJ322DRAFT_1060813 [Thelephora terrestris]|uniref:RanBP2-type domain-containing protein n=1 Tax=Thelephora terrestris TaxID=56493 RepID=A0A9P6L6N0_9AGAM|nr:hypothetical protein BJ322DRAFT_1060813 [Thelephora terrestris]
MTADRRTERRVARAHHASPYSQKTRNGRPPQQKSSGWSLAGLLSYLNPLRSRHSEEPEEETEEEISQDELDTNQSSQSSHDVFGSRTQPAQPLPPPPPAARPPDFFANRPSQPAGPSTSQLTALPELSTSPLKNVDAVKSYLEQNGSRPLNQVEIAGLVSMLQDSIDNIDDDTQQPFRFSKSPSRAGSPATSSFPTASSSTISSNATATPKTPTRTLSKNPNGTYKWQGAGSARRNRYHSPAFGSPSSGNKIKLQPAETAKGDLKRRRVGQDAESSSPQKSSASRQSSAEPTTAGPSSTGAPDVGDTAVNGSPQSKPQLNGINTSRLSKGTAPAVSSPLRQAWGQDDLPSPNSSSTSAPKPSRAAAFMTELIREATPPKKPDIANPYQTASPVKTVKPPTKKPVRKPKAVSKPPPRGDKEKEQPKMSMQAIIEATLPKGSKRSRPPAHLSSSTNGSPETSFIEFPSQSPSPPPKPSSFPSFQNGSSTTFSRSRTITVEEVEDEEELSSPKKKQKVSTSTEPMIVEVLDSQPPSQQFIHPSEIIEPGDPPQLQTAGLNCGASSPSTISPTTAGRSFFGLKSSAPKEPSKLRFSIKADRDETNSSASSVSPSAAASPRDAKAEVLSISTSDLPEETFTLPKRMIRDGKSSGELRAEKEARGLADNDIPMDDVWRLSSTSAGPFNLNKAGPSTGPVIPPVTTTAITPPTANGGFDWSAAGLKPPKEEGGWKCGACELMNPTSATEKCTVCDTPKPGAVKPVTSPFSMPKPPSTPFSFETGSITTETTTATPSPAGFDWSAAGLKPPTNTGDWKCGVCELQNPASATEKCAVCDAPKPGAEKSSAPPSLLSMPKPPSSPFVFGFGNNSTMTAAPTNSASKGFDWNAAGLKLPTAETDGWKCETCDLKNPTSAKEKCTVCDTPKPGASSLGQDSGSKSIFSMPAPLSGPFLFGASNSTTSTSTTSSGFSFGIPKPLGSALNPGSTEFRPTPSATTTTTTTTSNGTVEGFNWGAAGLKPPSGSGGWRCSTCALMNSESAKEKCTVCDAPKP